MRFHLHAFSREVQYSNCGPGQGDLREARILAQQNADRLNERDAGEDMWGVEVVAEGGKIVARTGWRRNYTLD